MKFATTVVFLLGTTLVSAAPGFPVSRGRGGFTRGRGGFSNPSEGGFSQNGGSNGGVAGAAFFMTNEPSGNFVVASNIGRDGRLTFARAVSAAGRGLHGLSADNGPDGLFSQDSVKVAGESLFVVNPGSNTAVMFSIDPRNPSDIQMVGNPVSSGGEFPVSIAVNSKSKDVCVLNGGQVNGVACFTPDPKLGLIELPNTVRSLGLNQTTPATGPAGTVSDLLFNAAGTQLIASVKGIPPNAGFLAIWTVAADGSLSPQFEAVTAPTGGLLPFGMSLIPGNNNAIFATDAGLGFDVFDLSNSGANSSATTEITSAAGSNTIAAGASSSNAVNGSVAVCWSAFSPKTGNFFVTDIGTSLVTEVHVDKKTLKANIVKQYPQTPGSATIDDATATINGNDFLYVLAANATTVDVLSLPAPGKAKTIQSLNFSQNMRNAKVTINPNNLQGMAVFVN